MRAQIFTAPRWAQLKLNKTALDLKIAKETGKLPTNDIMQRSQFSAELLPHIAPLRAEIDDLDKRGLLGPIMGRGVEFLEGKAGTTGNPETDAAYAKLRTDLKLFASGLNRAHFGGRAGIETLGYFNNLLGGAFRSKAALNGAIDESSQYLKTYAGATPEFGEEGQFGNTTYSPTATETVNPIGGKEIHYKVVNGQLVAQ